MTKLGLPKDEGGGMKDDLALINVRTADKGGQTTLKLDIFHMVKSDTLRSCVNTLNMCNILIVRIYARCRPMKKLILVLDDKTVMRARKQAAREKVRLSRFVGELMRQHWRESQQRLRMARKQ